MFVSRVSECTFCFFMDIKTITLFIINSQSLSNYIIVKFLTFFTFPKFKNPIKSILFTFSHYQFPTKNVRMDIRQYPIIPTILVGIEFKNCCHTYKIFITLDFSAFTELTIYFQDLSHYRQYTLLYF